MVTEKADDATARAFCEHLERHGVKVSGCNVGGADIRTREGFELTERRIQFAGRWFAAKICVTGAGQPADLHERRTIVAHLRRLGDTACEHGMTLALETHKGPTQNARAMLALDGRDRSSSCPPQLRHGQYRLLQCRHRPLRPARASEAPGGQRAFERQPGRFRRLVFSSRRRRRRRQFHPRSPDPRRRGFRRAVYRSRSRASQASPSLDRTAGKIASLAVSHIFAPAGISIE